MKWHVEKTVELRPTDGLSGLPALLLLVLLAPLLLAVALLVLMGLAMAGIYHAVDKWRGQKESRPAAEPTAPAAPVRLLDTPTLVLELLDEAHITPGSASDELSEAWAEALAYQDSDGLSIVQSRPALPGLEGQLVTGFVYPWRHGLLLQLLEAAAGGPAATSFLVFVDPAAQTWEKVDEVGFFQLYRLPDSPVDVIEGWNQQLGKIKLRL